MTPYHFEEIIKKSFSLDLLYMLQLVEQQFDLVPLCEDSMRIAALYQGLVRKGLITENDTISLKGQELLDFIKTKTSTKLLKKKPPSGKFETWWKTFPGTDTFKYKNKVFRGSRSIRAGKQECRIKFEKILNEGDYTAEEITAALEYDVVQKKESSIKNNTNKLKYLQNSLTYLNQRSFEPFIELIKEGIDVEESPGVAKGTDI